MVVEKLSKLRRTVARSIDKAFFPKPEDYEIEPDAYMADLSPREAEAVKVIVLFVKGVKENIPDGVHVLGRSKNLAGVELYVTGEQSPLAPEQRNDIKEALNERLREGPWEPVSQDETVDIIPNTSFRSMNEGTIYEPVVIRRPYPSIYVPTGENTGVRMEITDMRAEFCKNIFAGSATRFSVLV